MPRDSDKDNDSRGRRGPARGGPPKGRSGKPRGPEKKFAKRSPEGRGAARPPRGDRDSRPPRADRGDRPFRRREEGDAPRRDFSDRPKFKRDDRGGEQRSFKPRGDRPFSDRSSRDGEKRPFKPRGDRPSYGRDDSRPAGRSGERKFGEKRPYAPRGDRPERKFEGERKFSRGGPDRSDRPRDRGERSDSKPWQKRDAASRGDRPPRKDFGGRDRSQEKPWQKRDDRQGGEDRPRFSRSRDDRAPGDRPFRERPKFDRPREDRPKFDRPRRDAEGERGGRGGDRPKFNRPRERSEGRSDWHEHPRSEGRFGDRPRRENEDESRIFEKRPAFGGRGAYRQRDRDFEGRPRREDAPKPKKAGERIAKVLARAGLASRRDAEEMVTQGRVTVNGRVINSPALDVTKNDVVMVDGKPLPERERTRLFLYHKPRGLMTTHDDPEGRPTVFDNLPEGLPRLISVGRLDFNTEGLLLLTNDGGLARTLELPDTGWLRRYRVRAHGDVTQAQLDELKNGIEVEGVKYGPIEATLERDQGANVWLVFAIREGKNREVRNVCAHLGLEVNRLIRVSYGPFQLGEIPEGQVEEVRSRVLREQLGDKVIEKSGAQFDVPQKSSAADDDAPRESKPANKRAVINDRKGRRVLVQRTGSEEARERNEMDASGYGPPRRPKRGYHGKRDLTPRED
ncbi:pseudouridine synthase [Bradyrhizobium sp. R2.2-H]|jgi:23S rRNA pseudouridine2605 synthase|uniref:pseudouridine synthase n=1 Tax=unclassified Bradyrhizobium TaxID=2631580 RepID=UPI0010EFA48B|nr:MULTISPECIES: pseudouridine synthase [unclassified Bradyrhizobium]TCU73665.1 pseudouridine synthase [Bradyrhizobium sp. Y-H1]TCU76145.1 pseudouridine synthase [Bradyrhizobium sp. R2.2-H]